MRKLTVLFLLLAGLVSHAQETMPDLTRAMVLDSRTGRYLATVPESLFDDGTVAAYAERDDVDFTFLPILSMQSEADDFGYEYSPGTATLLMPDGSDQAAMYAKVKWRGGTTNAEGKHKRNYHIKFLDQLAGLKQDRKFFGLRKDNSWLLDAAQVDFSRVRNRVATDLWNDFATKPYYADREPKALTGTRGQFIEVFLNGEYRGIYCMTEAMDRSQMKLRKYEEADPLLGIGSPVIHGQLWKSGGFENAMSWAPPTPFDNTSETWGSIEVKYPDIEDVNPTDWSTLYDAERFVADVKHSAGDLTPEETIATRQRFCEGISQYFDMPVLIDYYVFFTVLSAIDNDNGKNIYWACYDREEDRKLTLAVWDLDCTVGGYFSPGETAPVASVWPYRVATCSSNLFYSLDKFNADGFHDRMVERYRSLRTGVLSAESLKSRYTGYMDMLEKAGAYSRETARWSGDSDLGGKALDFAAERENICHWIDERLAFLDENIDATPECNYGKGVPVMEMDPEKVSYPENPYSEEPLQSSVSVNYDNGLTKSYSNSAVMVTHDAVADSYQLLLGVEVNLNKDGVNFSDTWQMYPEESGAIGSPVKVFVTGHYMGTYIMTTDSYISGISTMQAERPNSSPCYTLLGTRASDGYRGVVIQNGKKKVLR